MNTVKHLSVAETAKLVRVALKKEFPGVKFSVRSESYAGGASIHIRWTNGPTTKMVDGIAGQFSGADFDGMIDMKVYNDSWLLPDGSAVPAYSPGTEGSTGVIPGFNHEKPHKDAVKVSFGADFIFTNRDYTLEFVQAAAVEFQEKSGVTPPAIKVTDSGHAYFDDILFSHNSIEREYRSYLGDYAEGIGITGDRWYATTDEPAEENEPEDPIMTFVETLDFGDETEPAAEEPEQTTAAKPEQWLGKDPDWYCPID